MRLALAALLVAAAAPARADTWAGGVESGIEYDSNVHRLEVDPSDPEATPVAVPLARAGGRVEGAGTAGWGDWSLSGQSLIRKVLGEPIGEDVGVVAGDARWDRTLGARRARVGARASYYDAVALESDDVVGVRAFALAAADAQLTLLGDTDPDDPEAAPPRLVASAGLRDFRYKLDDDFDWRGPALGARFVTALGAYELAATYRLERRSYRGRAFANGCAPDEPVAPACFVPTDLARIDLHHVADAELTYTGGVVATAGYHLAINDSTSYGQSLVRHRLTASVTAALPARLFATAGAALQLDQYLDPLLLARDVSNQTFTSIDDENRSLLSVRLSRRLGHGWTAEARWGFTADSLSGDDARFRRHVVYGGVTWGSSD